MAGRPKRDDGRNSQTVGKNVYNEKNYDRIAVQVAKGERDKVKAYAVQTGTTVNGLINRLLAEKIPNFISLDSNDNYTVYLKKQVEPKENMNNPVVNLVPEPEASHLPEPDDSFVEEITHEPFEELP